MAREEALAVQLPAEGGLGLNYIYFCWGSAHSSVTAAALHLGHLSCEHQPTVVEVMQIPRFDQTPNGDIGQLFYMGDDDQGHRVYVLGLGADHNSYAGLFDHFLRLLGLHPKDYRFVNCLPCVNWYTRIGGFSSRSLGLVWFGRRLAAFGVRKSFATYVNLVNRVRSSRQQELGFLDWSPGV
ncbi:MAG: DUF3189 family protein [Bacillota bacterium]|jgi:hypothetical protein